MYVNVKDSMYIKDSKRMYAKTMENEKEKDAKDGTRSTMYDKRRSVE